VAWREGCSAKLLLLIVLARRRLDGWLDTSRTGLLREADLGVPFSKTL
jgi:hypothetical protein